MDVDKVLNRVHDGNGLFESRMLASLEKRGVCLAPADIARIAESRRSLLAEADRVEFDVAGVNALVEELAAAQFCQGRAFVATVEEALEVFYVLREKLPIEVPDEEIAHEVAAEFARAEGCCDLVDADAMIAALAEVPDGNAYGEHETEEYCIQDDAGTIYRADDAEWLYDEFGEGWGGERWEADYE